MSRLRAEDGITLIEAIIAAFCLALVLGASASLFGVGDESSIASQHQTQEINAADQVIEQIRSSMKQSSNGFSSLAMSAAPSAGTGSTLLGQSTVNTDPNNFVSAASGCGSSNMGYLIESNYDNSSEGTASGVSSWSGCPTGAEPLVVAGGGIVSPQQTETIGGVQYTVYGYVTDTNVGCSSTVLSGCNSSNTGTPVGDARRLIIAVVRSNTASYTEGVNTPIYLSTIFTNPVPGNQSNTSIGISLGATVG